MPTIPMDLTYDLYSYEIISMELGACDSESEESKVQCVERLLRSKLPGYIISCMLAAGFDTLDTLARMDVGN